MSMKRKPPIGAFQSDYEIIGDKDTNGTGWKFAALMLVIAALAMLGMAFL